MMVIAIRTASEAAGRRPRGLCRAIPVCALLFTLLATAIRADETDLVTTRAGTVPVVLSSPHGGTKPIPDVAVRTRTELPKFQTVRDEHTAELTEKIAAALKEELGQKPYVVILRAERKYVDVNRPSEQAYESELAKPVYDAFHAALRKDCDELREKRRALHRRRLLFRDVFAPLRQLFAPGPDRL